ncbi:hypothetical protein QBC42DRAFT_326006, partial [Cladorrhinum samala]
YLYYHRPSSSPADQSHVFFQNISDLPTRLTTFVLDIFTLCISTLTPCQLSQPLSRRRSRPLSFPKPILESCLSRKLLPPHTANLSSPCNATTKRKLAARSHSKMPLFQLTAIYQTRTTALKGPVVMMEATRQVTTKTGLVVARRLLVPRTIQAATRGRRPAIRRKLCVMEKMPLSQIRQLETVFKKHKHRMNDGNQALQRSWGMN